MRNLLVWLKRVLVLGYVICIAIGFIALRSPGHGAEPLVPRSGWTIEGSAPRIGFVGETSIPPDIAADREAVFFRSFGPDGPTRMRVASTAFDLPSFVGVPVVGYLREPGFDLYLECLGNAARLDVARADAHEDWYLAVLKIPEHWCNSKARLVGASSSSAAYMGFGTPFKISLMWWLRDSFASAMLMHLVAFLAFAVPVIAISAWANDDLFPREIAAIAPYGVWLAICYAAFFALWADAILGALAIELVAAGSVLVVLLQIRALGWRFLLRRAVALQLPFLFAISLAAVALLDCASLNAGRWNPAFRFLPAVWSSDHVLPIMVANAFTKALPLHRLLGGNWHVSDRPPLMSGWLMFSQVSFNFIFSKVSRFEIARAQVIAEIVCQCVALVALIGLTKALLGSAERARQPRTVLALVTVLLSPFVLFNVVYGWPKLLAGGLVLFSLMPLMSRARSHGAGSSWLKLGTWSGLFLALAMLSHSGVALGLVALPLIYFTVATPRAAFTFGSAALAILVLVYLPWSIWVRLADPPGDALLRYALVGASAYQTTAQSVPLRQLLSTAYASLSLSQWLGLKRIAVAELFGLQVPAEIGWIRIYLSGVISQQLLKDFLSPFRGILLSVPFGLIAFLPAAATRRLLGSTAELPIVRVLFLSGMLGILASVLLTMGVQLTITQSYFSILLLQVAGLLVMVRARRSVFYLALAAELGYSGVVWILYPVMASTVAAAFPIMVAAIALALSVLILLDARFDAFGAGREEDAISSEDGLVAPLL